MPLALGVLALYHLGLGLFMVAAPGTFYDALGPFPPENAHYIRDVATFYLAFGAALAVAVRRPSWRVPVLALVLIEYVVHVVNHAVDVGKAETDAKGWTALISLLALTALIGILLRKAAR
jgi:Domain of unknown function (DUF4345)